MLRDTSNTCAEMEEQLRPLFDRSPVGVYLYVTDVHKICNERMAQMHGMTVEEWEEYTYVPERLYRRRRP